MCNKDLLQQSLELQTEVIGGYQQPDQVPLDKQDFSMGQEFRGASPINLCHISQNHGTQNLRTSKERRRELELGLYFSVVTTEVVG